MKKDEEMKFTIPYASAVRIKSPYPNSDNYTWHAYVNVKDMPKSIPTEVNPRETNMRTKVAKNLVSSLETNDQSFYKKNRGILFSAKKLSILWEHLSLIWVKMMMTIKVSMAFLMVVTHIEQL
ncbi:AIPR family protein (plasmid) [Lactiplantibacillus plantarum]|nr:AIPR family protein [Lactiplantibacillus plantarum]